MAERGRPLKTPRPGPSTRGPYPDSVVRWSRPYGVVIRRRRMVAVHRHCGRLPAPRRSFYGVAAATPRNPFRSCRIAQALQQLLRLTLSNSSRGRRPSGCDSEGSPRRTSSTTPERGRRSVDSDSATTRLPTLKAMLTPDLFVLRRIAVVSILPHDEQSPTPPPEDCLNVPGGRVTTARTATATSFRAAR